MKFGKTFESHLTPEWRQQYMNYSNLSALIRNAVAIAPDADVPRDTRYIRERDTTMTLETYTYYDTFERNFFAICHQELSRVEDFYAQKLAEARRKLEVIKTQLITHQDSASNHQRGPTARHLGLVCSEFYLSLIMLQNFRSLNYTAFHKICKKYDKYIRSSMGAFWFRDYVSAAPFTKDELLHMIGEMEQLYTTYLTNGDRSKAMDKLRVPPLRQASPPAQVFMAGVLLGLFVVSAIMVLISIYYVQDQLELISSFVRLYRGLICWVLCSFYLAINVYVWQNVGINHVLIFDVDLRKHIPATSFLEVASGVGYFYTFSMLLFLHHNEFGIADPYLLPLVCLLLSVVLLLNPVRMMNYPARMWLLRCIGRVLAAPFFHVSFADFWLADQLNSLSLCLVDNYHIIRFYIRYYIFGAISFDYEPDWAIPIIRCLPAWFRLAQCLRRYRDNTVGLREYILNAIKYATCIAVVIFSTIVMETNEKYESMFANPWIWGYLSISLVSTVYCITWDLVWDFGLLQVWKRENFMLRQNLVYPKWFYYFAIVANISIRFFWLMEVYLIYYHILLPYNCKSIASLLEITRRFIWNFLRLENEHLFNCGNYRATRDIFLVPLVIKKERDTEVIELRSQSTQTQSRKTK